MPSRMLASVSFPRPRNAEKALVRPCWIPSNTTQKRPKKELSRCKSAAKAVSGACHPASQPSHRSADTTTLQQRANWPRKIESGMISGRNARDKSDGSLLKETTFSGNLRFSASPRLMKCLVRLRLDIATDRWQSRFLVVSAISSVANGFGGR